MLLRSHVSAAHPPVAGRDVRRAGPGGPELPTPTSGGVSRAGDPQEGPGCFSLSIIWDKAWRECNQSLLFPRARHGHAGGEPAGRSSHRGSAPGGATSCEQHLGAGVGSTAGGSRTGASSTPGAAAAAAHGVTLQPPAGSLRGGGRCPAHGAQLLAGKEFGTGLFSAESRGGSTPLRKGSSGTALRAAGAQHCPEKGTGSGLGCGETPASLPRSPACNDRRIQTFLAEVLWPLPSRTQLGDDGLAPGWHPLPTMMPPAAPSPGRAAAVASPWLTLCQKPEEQPWRGQHWARLGSLPPPATPSTWGQGVESAGQG